jgi:Arc/MetJ-type ribon-helix-helix transcriptional regulator
MVTLHISIRDELMALIEAQVAQGRYGSPDEYVQALLERDARRQRARRASDGQPQEGSDGDPSESTTSESWDAMRRKSADGLAAEDA